MLATWERDDVTLPLATLPAAEIFRVNLRSPRFSAELRLRCLPDDGGLRAATVEQFSGSLRAAIAAAANWLDDELDLPEVTMLQAALEDLAATAETPAPLPPVAADTSEVRRTLLVGATMARKSGEMPHEVQQHIEARTSAPCGERRFHASRAPAALLAEADTQPLDPGREPAAGFGRERNGGFCEIDAASQAVLLDANLHRGVKSVLDMGGRRGIGALDAILLIVNGEPLFIPEPSLSDGTFSLGEP